MLHTLLFLEWICCEFICPVVCSSEARVILKIHAWLCRIEKYLGLLLVNVFDNLSSEGDERLC